MGNFLRILRNQKWYRLMSGRCICCGDKCWAKHCPKCEQGYKKLFEYFSTHTIDDIVKEIDRITTEQGQ